MNTQHANQFGADLAGYDRTLLRQQKQSKVNALILALVGIIAGLVAFAAIQMTGKVFELPPDLVEAKLQEGRNQSPEVMRQFHEGLLTLDYKHAALWLGIAGATAGILFGLTLGKLRRSRTSMVTGALSGLIMGCIIGACGGLAATYVGENLVSPERKEKLEVPAEYSMLLHGTTWLIIGSGIGLGTGVGATRNRFSFAIGSMFMGGIAGAAGGTLYPFLASVAMPFVDPSLTIPQGDLNRIVWIGLPFIFIGLTLGRRG